MQKIRACLWFENQAEEAANYYVSIFENSRITDVSYYGEAGPAPAGTVLTVTFELDGQEFFALNGGPEFKFTEAVSFYVDCKSQAEVDRLWAALTAGGEEQPCGWLKDRYGVSWQIVPTELAAMMQDKDPQKARRVTEALFQMKKLDLQTLQDAYAGKPVQSR